MTVTRLVIFLIPPEKIVNGGIMSIFSLCKESRAFIPKGAVSAVCVFPGKKSYRKNDLFENNEYIYELPELLAKYPNTTSLLLQIPEYSIKDISLELPTHIPKKVHVSINVLNQNIDMMPSIGTFANLLLSSHQITQTTAHAKYATKELARKFSTPLMHLSVFIDKKQCKKLSYTDKDKVILYSPDEHESKDIIVESLKKSLPDYTIREIKNLTYAQYKTAVQKSRYVITFGEGLDGYLIESCFSGSVAFSVYNERFFPSRDFIKIGSIYSNYDEMAEKIVTDILSMDRDQSLYLNNQMNMERILESIYDKRIYLANLKRFYKNNFDFMPTESDRDKFIDSVLIEKNKLINDWEAANTHKDREIKSLKKSNQEYATLYENSWFELTAIQKSAFWRFSNPIRKIISLFKRSKSL